jgi:hypothetical protein
MNTDDQREKLGKMLVETLKRAAVIGYYSRVGRGGPLGGVPDNLNLKMDAEMRESVRRIVDDCVDSAISDLLYTLDNPSDYMSNLQIVVDGVNVLDGDIQSCYTGAPNWIVKYGDTSAIGLHNYLDVEDL